MTARWQGGDVRWPVDGVQGGGDPLLDGGLSGTSWPGACVREPGHQIAG